jgi:hypothetical protein
MFPLWLFPARSREVFTVKGYFESHIEERTYFEVFFFKLCPGLRPAQPWGLTDRLCVLFPILYLKMEAEFSFRNFLLL